MITNLVGKFAILDSGTTIFIEEEMSPNSFVGTDDDGDDHTFSREQILSLC